MWHIGIEVGGSLLHIGTWYALRGLAAVGKTYNDTLAIRNGVDFFTQNTKR